MLKVDIGKDSEEMKQNSERFFYYNVKRMYKFA